MNGYPVRRCHSSRMDRIAQRQVLLRFTDEQYAELRAMADEIGLPVQQLVELRLFGQLRPRFDPRAPRPDRRKRVQDEELPIAG